MNTYLIITKFGGNWDESYVEAASEKEAIAIVRSYLTARVRRFASVFAA